MSYCMVNNLEVDLDLLEEQTFALIEIKRKGRLTKENAELVGTVIQLLDEIKEDCKEDAVKGAVSRIMTEAVKK